MRQQRLSTPVIWQIPGSGSGAAGVALSVLPSRAAWVVATVITASVFAPWFVHLVPVAGAPLGATLLPMFYAPLLAALVMRLPLAVLFAAVTPIVSRLLTGLPPNGVLANLILEVAVFVTGVRVLRRFHWGVVAPVAYVFALAVTSVVSRLGSNLVLIDFLDTIRVGWPGVAIIGLMGYVAHRTMR